MSKLYKVQTRFLFHSDIKLKIPIEFDDLYSILEEVNEKYNSYSETSYISKINKNSGSFVEVNDETIEILEKVIYYSDKLNGEYDITIMPLIKLWGFYKKNPQKIPLKEEIEEIKKLVNYKNIQIDKKNKRVKIEKNQEIITGSFIKSYAVDKMFIKMKEIGITDAIVNAGGSTIVALNDSDNTEWGIIVEGDGEDLFDINISNESYSTSNQLNTYIAINGEKYGHILSPKTGYPSQNKQIGIVTESAFIGDIISTGLYNQTLQNFSKLMKKLSDEIKIEGFLMDKNNEIFYSEGFSNYIENK
ncbi:MAG: FAD:protein FMN transferase [Leptotrichiaceae bacterium]|nr:FAD:protein FMN transferase [Leptotrichiaceae bacterium]MBP6282096.1 FAD:protein FMN transferase [Leptotrichiaceae bacterium]MBP7101233.1 FAD:protein FMN transferase [Leptotrichiaceae bacterium]